MRNSEYLTGPSVSRLWPLDSESEIEKKISTRVVDPGQTRTSTRTSRTPPFGCSVILNLKPSLFFELKGVSLRAQLIVCILRRSTILQS
jgi:hypothetical protein